MTFWDYQQRARATAIYPTPITYPALGLNGEAGEVAEKVKKWLRDDKSQWPMSPERLEGIAKELGDCLWYIANLASDLELDLGEVALANLQKLGVRKLAGTLGGDGDNR